MGDLSGRTAIVVGPGTDADLAIVAALAEAGAHVLIASIDGTALSDRAGQDVGILGAPPEDPASAGAIVERGEGARRPPRHPGPGPPDRLPRPHRRHGLGRLGGRPRAPHRDRRGRPGVRGGLRARGGHRPPDLDRPRAGLPGRGTASAVANGLVGASRAMAVEWARKPVRVNVVAQGIVLDEADRAALADGSKPSDRILLRAPSHRIGTAAETAALVRFLVDDRSRFITGQTISVDGGWASLTQHAEGLRVPVGALGGAAAPALSSGTRRACRPAAAGARRGTHPGR